ncbi:hypothetical protein SBRCBS47491_009576 [Sporothrix bragantina]|uniref:Uncharacterized protein n=1 Tax=Sporothrix bragantina TaxID=671064 RepID=A0ABP0CZB2_9PEZI
MFSLKMLYLVFLATAAVVAHAAAVTATTFRTPDGKVITMKLVKPGDIPNRVNISDVQFVPAGSHNDTATEPASKRAAKRAAEPMAEPVAKIDHDTVSLSKRDGVECFLAQLSANGEDCEGICSFMADYGSNVATIPPYDEIFWDLGTCTLAVSNRTPCEKIVAFAFFAPTCVTMLEDCVFFGYDGYYDLGSYGMSAALLGGSAPPAYSLLAC